MPISNWNWVVSVLFPSRLLEAYILSDMQFTENKSLGCCVISFQISFRPRQNGRHFADDIFKYICWNENVRISIEFVPQGQINNIPAWAQKITWRRSGDKPLSEPMMVSSLTHICVTGPQWVKQVLYNQSVFHDHCFMDFLLQSNATVLLACMQSL